MKAAPILLLFLISASFGQTDSASKSHSATLSVELRTSSTRVHLSDDMVLTVLFRSPDQDTTIWNALGWGPAVGLFLHVWDSSGHEVENSFAPFFHPLPPDLTGRNALITIGGNVFAGFDDRIQVKSLFPKPGQYRLYCGYLPPLSRHYFQGQTIWGKEDGPVGSAPISVLVEE